MKIEMFHLHPYRDLPEDFAERYRSVWVDVPTELFDPVKAHQMYNDTLDELEYGASLGFDGICVNEHHQNAYGMMPAPSIMAGALARRTRDVALIVLGNSIALYDPPIRVAEEMAMLDCISGGRMISGFPVGSTMDTNYAYGSNPATLRDKYREATDLIVRAWTDPEVFSWDGRFYQLRYVNPWPRPIQKPHPPIWVPGVGSIETWEWCLERQYMYSYLSYFGFIRGKQVMDGFWAKADEMGVERNPYQAGFMQLVVTADSEQECEERYGAHAEYFFNKMLHVYPGFDAPGYRTLDSIRAGLESDPIILPGARVGSLRRLREQRHLEGPERDREHHLGHARAGDREARAGREGPLRRPPVAALPDWLHAARPRDVQHRAHRHGCGAKPAPPPFGVRGPLVAAAADRPRPAAADVRARG